MRSVSYKYNRLIACALLWLVLFLQGIVSGSVRVKSPPSTPETEASVLLSKAVPRPTKGSSAKKPPNDAKTDNRWLGTASAPLEMLKDVATSTDTFHDSLSVTILGDSIGESTVYSLVYFIGAYLPKHPLDKHPLEFKILVKNDSDHTELASITCRRDLVCTYTEAWTTGLVCLAKLTVDTRGYIVAPATCENQGSEANVSAFNAHVSVDPRSYTTWITFTNGHDNSVAQLVPTGCVAHMKRDDYPLTDYLNFEFDSRMCPVTTESTRKSAILLAWTLGVMIHTSFAFNLVRKAYRTPKDFWEKRVPPATLKHKKAVGEPGRSP